MVETKLWLEDFVKKEGLANENAFDENMLRLLGNDLKEWLKKLLGSLGVQDQPKILGEVEDKTAIRGAVYIAKGAFVETGALVIGPAYIGEGTEVRHGAYVRGNVYAGAKCIIGHTTEVKGSVFFDGAKAGHFAYVGDSILGRNVNLGAGTKLANLRLNNKEVKYLDPRTNSLVNSGMRKFGSILGDDSQTGCNSVCSPGTLLMPGTMILPCAHFRGTKTK